MKKQCLAFGKIFLNLFVLGGDKLYVPSVLCPCNRECAFGLSGRGRGGSRLPVRHSTQFIGHEVMRLSTYYCAREAFCAIM